jgi:Flp pilus assembly pilin Flp
MQTERRCRHAFIRHEVVATAIEYALGPVNSLARVAGAGVPGTSLSNFFNGVATYLTNHLV